MEKSDETHQPPLYYALVALATGWISAPDELNLSYNPRAATEGGYAGVNLLVHDPQVEGFPYRGTILALHAARLVSVAISTLGLIATYGIGRHLFPARPVVALGATAIHAFWPQYVFIGSVVTNDIMVTVSASWFVFFLIRATGNGASQSNRSRLGDWLGLGLSLGSALLSKNNALALLPAGVVGSAVALVRVVPRLRAATRHQRGEVLARPIGGLVAAVLGLLALSGWWYARNVAVYGQVFGQYQEQAGAFVDLVVDPQSGVSLLTNGELAAMLRYGFLTFWASFGWGNLGLSENVYLAAGLFCAVGAVGAVYALLRDRQRRWPLLLMSFTIISFVAVYVNLKEGSPYLRGRIFLPIITPICVLLAAGWARLLDLPWPHRGTSSGMGLIAVGMLLHTALLPFLVIAPAYARPPLITGDLDTIPNRLDIVFHEEPSAPPAIALLGYETDTWRVKPGEDLSVTLYWRGLADMGQDYTLAVKIVGSDGTVYGARHLFPGRGNFPTSLWQPGDTFRETYRVPIVAEPDTRIRAQISVSFFRDDRWEADQTYLPVTSMGGYDRGSSALFGQIKIAGEPPSRMPPQATAFRLGDSISLVGYDLVGMNSWGDRRVEITIYWAAQDRIPEDYSVFLHLMDVTGKMVAQADSQPMAGSYPTSLWEQGEVIVDPHPISVPWSLPSGTYTVVVGLYSLDTLARLPVLDSADQRVATDAIALGQIEVESPAHWIALPVVQRNEG